MNTLPFLNRNPVNGRPSSFDGMPRADFFMRNAGKTAETGTPVYNDIRGAMRGRMPAIDPRSLGEGGMNFVGPATPSGVRQPPVLDAATGQVVATQPAQTAPPRQLPPSGNGSRIPQSSMNRGYAPGSLAARPVRQIGRSANDPMRIAERMRRQGDPSMILRFGMQRMGQDFAREMNDANFQQSQQLNMQARQQQEMDAATRYQQNLQQWGREQAAMKERDATNFEQQRQLEAERRAADVQQQEAERNRVPSLGVFQVPGTNYVMPTADGRVMGTLPMQRPDPQPLPGMVPTAMESNGVRYETPQTGKREKPDISWQEDPKTGVKVPYQTIIDDKGNVTLRRVKIIDENNDGIDDRMQGGGQKTPDALPAALPQGKSPRGAMWSLNTP